MFTNMFSGEQLIQLSCVCGGGGGGENPDISAVLSLQTNKEALSSYIYELFQPLDNPGVIRRAILKGRADTGEENG